MQWLLAADAATFCALECNAAAEQYNKQSSWQQVADEHCCRCRRCQWFRLRPLPQQKYSSDHAHNDQHHGAGNFQKLYGLTFAEQVSDPFKKTTDSGGCSAFFLKVHCCHKDTVAFLALPEKHKIVFFGNVSR